MRTLPIRPGLFASVVIAASACQNAPSNEPASQDVATYGIHAGSQTDIFAKTFPDGTCTLQAEGHEPLTIHADGRGVTTFFAMLAQPGMGVDYRLHCLSEDRAQDDTQRFHVDAVEASRPEIKPNDWMKDLPNVAGTFDLFPEMTDVDAADDRTLESLGALPRPNKVADPTGYGAWQTRVKKLRAVEAKTIPLNVSYVAPASITNSTAFNWSGMVSTAYTPGTNNVFTNVRGKYRVPVASNPSASGPGFYTSVTWIGIGGWDGSAMPQFGTAQQMTCTMVGRSLSCAGNYYAWIEYIPAKASLISSVLVKGLDQMDLNMLTTSNTATCRVSRLGTKACFQFIVNGGDPVITAATLPANGVLKATSAEWIMERPTASDGTRRVLPRFTDIPWTSTSTTVTGSDGVASTFSYDSPGATSFNVTMVTDTGSTLATAVQGTNGQFTSHYVSSN